MDTPTQPYERLFARQDTAIDQNKTMSRLFPHFVIMLGTMTVSMSLSSYSFARDQLEATKATQSIISFGTIDASAQASDSRLQERKVDIAESEIYVGDLLERISKQTGVTLIATDRYHTAGWRLCVSLRGLSLLETMNALRSAMSFKNAFWTWRRTKSKNEFTYELVASETQSAWEEGIRKRIQDDFEKRWQDTKATMKMSQSELDQSEKGSVAWFTRSKGSQLALKLLTTDLPQDELKDFIHGTRTSSSIPYANLSKQGKEFVDYRINEHNQLRSQYGYTPNTNLEQGIMVSLDRHPTKLTPSLMVLLDGIGGYTYLGGTPFEQNWRGNMEGEYLLRDDTATSPVSRATLREPADKGKRIPDFDSQPETQSNGQQVFRVTPFTRRFKQLSVADLEGYPSFSFIACLPQQKQSMPTPESPYDKMLEAYVARLREFGIGSKWNSSVLLMRYLPGVTRGDSDSIPSYAMIRWVNEHSAAAPDGEFSLDELIYLSTNWSPKEMLRLPREQYPYLYGLAVASGKYYKALGKETQETLAALQSPEGLPTNRLSPQLATLFHVDYPTTRSKTLRARLIRKHPTEYERTLTDYFDIFDPADPTKSHHQVGFGVDLPPRAKKI